MNIKSWSGQLLIALLAIFAVTFLVADIYAQKVRLRGKVTPVCPSGSSTWKFADIFADGNIAVQGSYNCRGAFIYDISNPDAPVLASWYNPGSNQQFLEAIVIGNRGYFGSGNGGGVHIVDLSNPRSPILLGIVNSTNGNGFNSIHEMVVEGNILIENFNGTSNKILKFIDISNPAQPVFIRDLNPTEPQWVHAMHVRGDKMYTSGWGNSSNRGRTEIYDISNIRTQAPPLLGFIQDASPAITAGNNMHSNWTSEDGNYLYSCRETTNGNGDLRVYDIRNPANPLLVRSIGMNALGLNAVTPHNPVVKGNLLFIAWYQAGVQVFDISNPADPKRIGQYDTFTPAFMPDLDDEVTAKIFEQEQPWDMICGAEALNSALPTSYDGDWAVYPFLGNDKVLAGDMTSGLFVLDVTNIANNSKNTVSDFDGDNKTDYSTFTPTTGTWNVELSSNSGIRNTTFGVATDLIVPNDYDGDSKTDYAVFRPTQGPNQGIWYILKSSGGIRIDLFGLSSDIPVPGDYDADGKADIAVFRPSNGVWYISQSTLGFRAVAFGTNGDKPLVGDYDNDGKADMTVFRPSTRTWYNLPSSSSIFKAFQFGLSDDKPVVGDFDGDAVSDYAVYRASSGLWYILNSFTNSITVYQFGLAEDMPIPADYDGDGKTDIAVFRPSSRTWYRLNSGNNSLSVKTFGSNGDLPSPSAAQPR
jgi:hypothetical protein